MNFKRTGAISRGLDASLIALLSLTVGLLGIESANAKNPLTEAPITAPSNYIAQVTDASNPIYGNWKLRYSVNGIVYESILVMKGFSGSMRTRYYYPSLGKQAVDQTMYLKSSPDGLILLGYNPVYAGTNTEHPTYVADNFLFAIEYDGAKAEICDDLLRCSAVSVQAIR
ncbi:hypothetical protein LC605_23660 [Nostoc sp. CHAB 5836]|uniref:hypothetical protein n=1 Tax=Nostoc sp. CHAB 5836 TaxID=2780404 RepID=UPI001E5169D8|nr:hypothetical protein [Nostoc sp. CHAB 5836]MCC5618025.1 hypothetical protein [Nostoc sp. CHAB 5836]